MSEINSGDAQSKELDTQKVYSELKTSTLVGDEVIDFKKDPSILKGIYETFKKDKSISIKNLKIALAMYFSSDKILSGDSRAENIYRSFDRAQLAEALGLNIDKVAYTTQDIIEREDRQEAFIGKLRLDDFISSPFSDRPTREGQEPFGRTTPVLEMYPRHYYFLKEGVEQGDLVLPEVVIGDLKSVLRVQAKGLIMPIEVTGDVDMSSLIWPPLQEKTKLRDRLRLRKKEEELRLPKIVGGMIRLPKLQSAKGVIFPEEVGGDVILTNLESAEGLVLPKVVLGEVHLPKVSEQEKQEIRKLRPDLKIV